ncbi:MAG TPA: hypothetical protein VFZ25_11460 [Chloroflexota bacterium]|nr:hypothetical protein [Chloroflexota bacterium]
MPIWQIVWLLKGYDGDAAKVADHLGLPLAQIEAAMRYFAAYPMEITAEIEEQAHAAANLATLLPNLEVFDVDGPAS